MVHIIVRRSRNGPSERDIVLCSSQCVVGYRCRSFAVTHLKSFCCIDISGTVKTSILLVVGDTIEVVDRSFELGTQARAHESGATVLRQDKGSNTRNVRRSH